MKHLSDMSMSEFLKLDMATAMEYAREILGLSQDGMLERAKEDPMYPLRVYMNAIGYYQG